MDVNVTLPSGFSTSVSTLTNTESLVIEGGLTILADSTIGGTVTLASGVFAAGTEAAPITVTVPVRVQYATTDGTATAAEGDYVAVADTLTFAPGQTRQSVSIPMAVGSEPDGDRSFFLQLGAAEHALVGQGLAEAIIYLGRQVSGYVYVDVNNNGSKDVPESGLPNVPVTVVGPVTRTTVTDATGLYQFRDLPPGPYSIFEAQPLAYVDGVETPGPAGLVRVENDLFEVSAVADDAPVTGFNFGEGGLRAEPIDARFLRPAEGAGQVEKLFLTTRGLGDAIAFRAGQTGMFSATAEGDAAVPFQLYTRGMLPVALSVVDGLLEASLDEGENYVLLVGATGEPAEIQLDVGSLLNGFANNPMNRLDVNGDGFVAPIDVLNIFNALALFDWPQTLPMLVAHYPDVNADGHVSPLDALLIINFLNGPFLGEAAEGELRVRPSDATRPGSTVPASDRPPIFALHSSTERAAALLPPLAAGLTTFEAPRALATYAGRTAKLGGGVTNPSWQSHAGVTLRHTHDGNAVVARMIWAQPALEELLDDLCEDLTRTLDAGVCDLALEDYLAERL